MMRATIGLRVCRAIHGSAGGQMQKTTARKFHGAPPGNVKAIPISGPLKGSRFLRMRFSDFANTRGLKVKSVTIWLSR
jgi:hypothetical protein